MKAIMIVAIYSGINIFLFVLALSQIPPQKNAPIKDAPIKHASMIDNTALSMPHVNKYVVINPTKHA